MSSFLQSVIDSVSDENTTQASTEETTTTTEETSQETSGETSQETQVTTEETTEESPKETKEEPPAETQETSQEDKQEPPKEKKDLSGLTKEEKAQHAFQRQLAKQRTKYETQIQQMHDDFKKQFDDFKKEVIAQKPKEPVKTRDDFPIGEGGDDAYISYLAELKVNKIMEERDAKAAKEAEEKDAEARKDEEARKAREESADLFRENCKECFKDEAEYAKFATKVSKGIANQLGEILDQVPAVRDYLFQDPNGPLVLNEMLDSKDAFVRVMTRAGNPMNAIVEMHDMAREIQARAKAATTEAPAENKPKGMPHLGKPGSRGGSAQVKLGSDKDIINYIRSVH